MKGVKKTKHISKYKSKTKTGRKTQKKKNNIIYIHLSKKKKKVINIQFLI